MLRLILTLALAAYANGAAAWQTGQLIDTVSERVLAGATENPYSPFPSTQARYNTVRSYVIRTGDREYTIAEQPSRYSMKSRVPHLVVSTPIRFRIEKRKVTFLDEDGKEYKGQIEREVQLKPAAQ